LKKAAIALGLLIVGGVAFFAFRSFRGLPVEAQDGVPPTHEAAQTLGRKIQSVKEAARPHGERPPQQLEVTEAELESYILFNLQPDIPAHLETVDIQLAPGNVGADVKLTFPPNATGNVAVDAILGGTHTMFVKGKLTAEGRQGRFTLEETRVDGIPVPTILIEGLLSRYVKPRYPEVDLSETFVLPWGIRSIAIGNGSASISY